MTAEKSVVAALSAVMADVQAIRKGQKNTAPNANYMFRGIDAVMNAVGPALRTHGVVIVPECVESHYRDVQTSTGKPSREATVTVTYRAYGPAGDSIIMQSAGEAMDSGDKGTPKAMSVAYRTLLLQALTIPTDEPEPDSQTYERAAQPRREPRRESAPDAPAKDGPPPKTPEKRARDHMFALLGDVGIGGKPNRDKALAFISQVVGRDVASSSEISDDEVQVVVQVLSDWKATGMNPMTGETT